MSEDPGSGANLLLGTDSDHAALRVGRYGQNYR
jgi:hypothetical protein